MSLYQPQDPSNSFYEAVQVGRSDNSYYDVTIYYTLRNRGRGEFSVTEGGTIIWDDPDAAPNRKLRVQTRNGDRFTITRRRGQGYHLNTSGFRKKELGRIYF